MMWYIILIFTQIQCCKLWSCLFVNCSLSISKEKGMVWSPALYCCFFVYLLFLSPSLCVSGFFVCSLCQLFLLCKAHTKVCHFNWLHYIHTNTCAKMNQHKLSTFYQLSNLLLFTLFCKLFHVSFLSAQDQNIHLIYTSNPTYNNE